MVDCRSVTIRPRSSSSSSDKTIPIQSAFSQHTRSVRFVLSKLDTRNGPPSILSICLHTCFLCRLPRQAGRYFSLWRGVADRPLKARLDVLYSSDRHWLKFQRFVGGGKALRFTPLPLLLLLLLEASSAAAAASGHSVRRTHRCCCWDGRRNGQRVRFWFLTREATIRSPFFFRINCGTLSLFLSLFPPSLRAEWNNIINVIVNMIITLKSPGGGIHPSSTLAAFSRA